jgi:uncharacterized caspase-like protein
MAGATAQNRRVALVVGAGRYEHAARLANTTDDALAIAAALARLGFDVDTVLDPDRAAFETAVRKLGERARGADAALFYYAGHALEYGGRNWLVPVQADLHSERDLRFETLDLDAVIEQMQGQSRVSILFLDACRENPFANALTAGTRALSLNRGLAAPQREAVGTMIVYATAPGQVAEDGDGPHSPFTAALLRHMEEPGVEIRQMLAEVRRDVRKATGGRQVPWDSSALEGQFYLHPVPASAQPKLSADANDIEVMFWDSVRNSSDPADLRAYLMRYPGGLFADLARNHLARLSAHPADEPSPAAVQQKANQVAAQVVTKKTAANPQDEAARRKQEEQAAQRVAEDAARERAQQNAAAEAKHVEERMQKLLPAEDGLLERQQLALLRSQLPPGPGEPARSDAATPQVAEAQRLLNVLGFPAGGVDGQMGPRTREAIRAYQSAHNLDVTGELSELLLLRLRTASPAMAAATGGDLRARAAAAAREGDTATAIRLYQDSLAANPKDADTATALADLYSATGDFEGALRLYTEAQALRTAKPASPAI